MTKYKTETRIGILFSKENFGTYDTEITENFKNNIKFIFKKNNVEKFSYTKFESFLKKYLKIMRKYIFEKDHKLVIFYRKQDLTFSYYLFTTEKEALKITNKWYDKVTEYKIIKYKNFLRQEKLKNI